MPCSSMPSAYESAVSLSLSPLPREPALVTPLPDHARLPASHRSRRPDRPRPSCHEARQQRNRKRRNTGPRYAATIPSSGAPPKPSTMFIGLSLPAVPLQPNISSSGNLRDARYDRRDICRNLQIDVVLLLHKMTSASAANCGKVHSGGWNETQFGRQGPRLCA